jgi:hypothetical protein
MKTLLKISILAIAFNFSLWSTWAIQWATRPAKHSRVIVIPCEVK